MKPTFTALIEREDDMYVSLCPELDIASQGYTIEEARTNLKEAIELFFEYASDEEIKQRLKSEIYITPIEVEIGETENSIS
ncbi:MAG: hypothetical protein A2X61_15615 [Ignavibacteria bacterium GWB2_35_12]|nr:MAG: hypothetical protein A2X63_04960 [Ignavibacteria bacterium GWA2_35_8]OGU40804.1 MAG: hypothetical protein A2X61_15615 [Ignavibacteria bacterium GWB2_35_12]OGU90322.1 MAG: hypothetical protein A2220_10860 [Ignavibacteria bacterium RIFOXYA2_FULL_35_10]OGV24631.1 MAG: hypothetical protein A2475_14390 [Ignavibacteria bacterium RIFOXYC2_FULL_35_21]